MSNPNTTPPTTAVKRYNAILTFADALWTAAMQFNTLGTVTTTTSGTNPVITATNLLTTNKTTVKLTPIRDSGDQLITIDQMTGSVITPKLLNVPTAGDQILLEIEVFTI